MADLVNSVLGGARSLIVGWILPVFVSLQIINLLILPELSHTRFITKFAHESSASQQLAFLAIAVVSGLVLAAIQSPLYRILEGYTLWPRKIADHRIEKHRPAGAGSTKSTTPLRRRVAASGLASSTNALLATR